MTPIAFLAVVGTGAVLAVFWFKLWVQPMTESWRELWRHLLETEKSVKEDNEQPVKVAKGMAQQILQAVEALERIRRNQLDELEELRSINEGLRWQQEFFKTQTLDVQEALTQRQAEAQEWQRNPQFKEQVEQRVAMLINQQNDEKARLEHFRRSQAAKKGAAHRRRIQDGDDDD